MPETIDQGTHRRPLQCTTAADRGAARQTHQEPFPPVFAVPRFAGLFGGETLQHLGDRPGVSQSVQALANRPRQHAG